MAPTPTNGVAANGTNGVNGHAATNGYATTNGHHAPTPSSADPFTQKLVSIEPLTRDVAKALSSPTTPVARTAGLDPIASTESIAYDFLASGGKHSRPFITLAVHDALVGGGATTPDGEAVLAAIPDAVRRAALSIETFHKASLVHDDIEDGDDHRYGIPAVHKQYGTPIAINVGDYLIGLGYRLVSRDISNLGAEKAADILDVLADCHLRLCEGQGAELVWRESPTGTLTPLDALKIYALKTSPAFEAAVLVGMRLAGEITPAKADETRRFARNLGVAFQILNDLKDWEGDFDNKLAAGGDLLSGRPTVLLALAMERLDGDDRARLTELLALTERATEWRLREARRLFERAGVFETAHTLIDRHQEKCEAIAESQDNDALGELYHYVIASVLERSEPAPVPTINVTTIAMS